MTVWQKWYLAESYMKGTTELRRGKQGACLHPNFAGRLAKRIIVHGVNGFLRLPFSGCRKLAVGGYACKTEALPAYEGNGMGD